jgi:protoheme IX farnesyltransferase
MPTSRWRAAPVRSARVADFVTLMKPEVTALVVVAAAIGFYLGSGATLDLPRLLGVVFGTGLVSGGTAALNMWIEREADGRMQRTARRPLPAGRMSSRAALLFGLSSALAGGAYLWILVNPLSSILALATLASYLLLYTPLKSRTHLCTAIGAIPGAAPPLIGWAAARGSLSKEAWALYAILFLWQFPHFLAIAWMYRKDYARAGMRMLPPRDEEGVATFRQILLFCALLIPVSLVPTLLGIAGNLYLAGATVLGLAFLSSCLWAARERTGWHARVLLHASVIYLPLLYALLAFDRRVS